MTKKVWILNHYALPPNLPGGTRHYDFSQELIKKGISEKKVIIAQNTINIESIIEENRNMIL